MATPNFAVQAHRQPSLRRPLAYVAWAVLLLAGCGTSTVQLVVARPAVINARAYGGTVSIGSWIPAYADYAEVAGQLRQEIADRVMNSVAGSVRLMDYGGGLVVTGRVDEYAMNLREFVRTEPCDKPAPAPPAVHGDAKPDKHLSQPMVKTTCTWRWYEWQARMAVEAKVTTASGEVLLWRPIAAQRSGKTYEAKDYVPAPPNAHAILQVLRQQVADRVAWLVAPRKERVDAVLYDCEEPAKAMCEAGVRLLAQSRFDEAVQAFTEAIGRLEAAKVPPAELAKAHWNRAIVFQYSGRFDEAWNDLQRAKQLDPKDAYDQQLVELQRERAMHTQLIQQGVTPPAAPAAPAQGQPDMAPAAPNPGQPAPAGPPVAEPVPPKS